MKELPIACTLSAQEMADRTAWLARLGERRRHGELRDGRLELRFEAGAAEEVRAWVEAERECCAFLTFDLVRSDDELRLAVTAPSAAEPVLEGLLAALLAPSGQPFRV